MVELSSDNYHPAPKTQGRGVAYLGNLGKNALLSAEPSFKGGKGGTAMAAKRKFEPEKINAALKLLRALPVKDNRKTTGETLHMLKGGILEALDKGYDRTEIRRTIATAEVVISATTFNDFLAGNLKDASENGVEADPKRKEGTEKTPTEPEATEKSTAEKTENSALEERKTATEENGNPENGKRETPTIKMREDTSARKADTVKMPSYYTPDLPDTEL
jgi:hypothetical protein